MTGGDDAGRDEDGTDEAPVPDVVVIPVTGELDLHAFSPRDVAAVVADYLQACLEKGLEEVRLVHGRGTGARRAEVRRLLRGHPDVVASRDAPPPSGGWGVTLVVLRKRDESPRRQGA